MTLAQHVAARPNRDSRLYHSRQGCDVGHKTNRVLDACEDRIEARQRAGRSEVHPDA